MLRFPFLLFILSGKREVADNKIRKWEKRNKCKWNVEGNQGIKMQSEVMVWMCVCMWLSFWKRERESFCYNQLLCYLSSQGKVSENDNTTTSKILFMFLYSFKTGWMNEAERIYFPIVTFIFSIVVWYVKMLIPLCSIVRNKSFPCTFELSFISFLSVGHFFKCTKKEEKGHF